MKKYLLLLTALFCYLSSFSQDFSNKGKEFWLAYCYHVGMVNGTGGQPVMTLYITSDVSTTCTVEIFGVATIQTVNVTPGVTTPVVIPNTYFINDDGLFLNKAIHVTAPKPVVVYSFITRAMASAATLCLPTNVLGKQYVGMSFTQSSNENNANSYITIVGVEDNTSVEIIPTNATKGGWAAGSTNVISLNKGQVYQVLGTTTGNTGTDLSGTTVRSIASGSSGCKRIAVFSGSGKINIGCSNGSSDNLYQQLYPVSSWGKKYLTVPSNNKPNNYYRILRSSPSANVTLNGVLIPSASFVNEYYQFLNSTPNYIESDLPISVTQYFTSQGCQGNGSPYDPDMIELNPVEQNINKVTLVSSPLTVTGAHEHYIHVIIKNSGATSTALSSFLYDNAPVPVGNWTVHPADPNYSYIYLTATETSHTLYSDSGFNAIAYGFGSAETYGYSAGTNVKDLYQQIGVQTQYGIEPSPSVCTGSPFKFKVSLPYKADSMYWDFHGAQPNPPSPAMTNVWLNSPVPLPFDSTTIVNGKTIYWYSLPTIYTFNTVGIYPITITTYTANSDGCGNTQDIDFDLDVSDPPVAGFSWTSNGCVNQAVQFTDTTHTVKPLYHWYWNFGDPASGANNISYQQNPSHLFSAPGTYYVKFSNITTPGCLSDTITKPITVTNIPVADFSFSSPLCETRAVTISDGSSASAPGVLAQWHWDFGDGNGAVNASNGNAHNITYPAFGPRTVTLMVETNSGCQSLVKTKTVTINSVPVAKFTHAQACLPYQSVNFTNTSTNADATALSYLWNFGEPSSGTANTSTLINPSHLYSTAGTFSVKLTATNAGGCAKDTTINIADVYPYAHGDFTVNAENCFNTATVFTSTSTGNGAAITTWYWDFGDGSAISNVQNPSYTYTTPGTKTIKHWVKTVNGCVSDTMQKTVIVNPLPTADYTYTNPSCQNRTISFTDASTPNVGTLTTWAWDFNDPASGASNTSALQNPQHSFSSTGVYNVKLIVTNSKGCVNPVFSRQVTIEARPAAGYIVPEVCLNDTYAQFTDTSHIAAGSITSWQWNFGDANSTVSNPNTSTLQNPPHSYTAVGSYTVQLIITSNAGCRDTIAHTLFVNGSFPVANFTVNNAGSLCANDSVRIVNTSTVFPGVITKTEIYWDNVGQPAVFETDNDPATNEVYSHLYPNFQSPPTKTYTIRFRAYSGGVCVNDKYQTITINAAPKVQFNAIPDTCLNIAPFQLTQASEVGGVPGTFVFTGPGVSSTGIFDPLSVGPGIYTIHYTFTSNTGCRDSATKQIKVLQAPVANFGFGKPACEKNTLLFSDSSLAPVGTITTWTWDFADGTAPVIRNNATAFTHTFNQAGDYLVKLYVTTNHGCNSIVKAKLVHINPLPKPSFTFPDTACLPASKMQFENTSTIADGTESSFTYLWNFGDPVSGPANASTAQNPLHIYAAVGPFSVNLKVKSGAGCIKDTTIIVNTIHPQPKAGFEFSKPSVCIGDNVICLDRTDGKDGNLSAWFWNFGDNSYSSLQNPEHIYNDIGNYKVEFYSINSFGCNSDTISKTFAVYPYPKVNAGPDLLVLEGDQATLNAVVSGSELQYLWTPNLFLNHNTIVQPVTKPTQDITYTIKVTAKGGCVKTDDVFVKVLMTPNIPNTFSPNNDGINDLWDIQYLNSYPFCKVQVFTRTGQLVFESKGYKTPWNGTYNGKPLPVDTYYYIIEPESGRKPVTGYVTIVK